MTPGGVVRSGERYNFALTLDSSSTNLSLPTFLNHSHAQPQLDWKDVVGQADGVNISFISFLMDCNGTNIKLMK